MAAVEADRVVVALIGDTSNLDQSSTHSADLFDRNMSKIERSATRAESQVVRSSGAVMNAQRNIARQLQDAGAQAGSGQSLLTILIQQAPQAADAMVDLGGKAGAVGRFFLNPWVAAAVAAASALAPLIANTIKFGNETDKLVEKMRQQARQSDQTRKAEDLYRITIDGVTESIRRRREEQAKALQTDQQAEQAALARARGELATQKDNLRAVERELAQAEKAFQQQSTSGEAGLALSPVADRIDQLRKLRDDLRKSIAAAEASVRGAEISIGEREVAGRVDAAVAATNAFTAALGRLRDERQRGLITQKQFNDQLEIETRKRDAAIKAAQDAQRQTNSNRVTLPLPVNGPITSGFGTRTAPTKGASTFHQALDIGVPVGTQVRAGAAGVVVYAGKLGGLGNVVIVDYGNGTIAEFGHLSQTLAKRGQQVNAGDVVALSGNSGVSTGPHLDYRLRTGARVENGRVVGGRYVDPRKPVSVAGGDAIANMEDAAAKSAQKIQEDFDALWDDIQRGGDQARDKIGKDFSALEGALDPTTAAATKLAEQMQIISDARLIGLIDDAREAELRFIAMHKAAADTLGAIIDIDSLRAGAAVEQQQLDEDERKRKDAEDRLKDKQERDLYQLADLYETLFTGGAHSFWDQFKREGLRALALLAAQATFKLITGQTIGMGGRGDFGAEDLIGSLLGSIFGRASGGYVGPGQTVRVNENRGGMELLRMGSQGGTVIPLGQAAAAAPRGGVTIIHAPQTIFKGAITTRELMAEIDRRDRASIAAAAPYIADAGARKAVLESGPSYRRRGTFR